MGLLAQEEAMQAEHVLDIVAKGAQLRADAERITGDVNEACLLVHHVVSRALSDRQPDYAAMRQALARYAAELPAH